MPNRNDKAKQGVASKHSKWELESEKIRKVQISLDFPDAADILLRTLAARDHKAPSSMIREIVGMPSNPPKRARIGVSFNDDELQELGQRYDVDPSDKAEIRRKLTEEVTSVLISAESMTSEGDSKNSSGEAIWNQIDSKKVGSKNTSQGAQRDELLAVHQPCQKLDGDSMKDLKTVSDSIYLRFQQALAKRNIEKL